MATPVSHFFPPPSAAITACGEAGNPSYGIENGTEFDIFCID
jgi:hypothetical protein